MVLYLMAWHEGRSLQSSRMRDPFIQFRSSSLILPVSSWVQLVKHKWHDHAGRTRPAELAAGKALPTAKAAAFAAAVCTLMASQQTAVAWAEEAPSLQHQQAAPAIAACKPKTSCVSTASFLSPSQYLPPWSFAPDSRDSAARALKRVLEDAGAESIQETKGEGSTTVQAVVPIPGRPGSDTVLVQLRDDGVALFSSRAAANRPDPPFCLSRGCISGPAERGRMEAIRNALGWAALEAEGGEDARWTQILLH